MILTYRNSVEFAAEWLDETEPNWYKKFADVVPEMVNPSKCVAGWVFRDRLGGAEFRCETSGYGIVRRLISTEYNNHLLSEEEFKKLRIAFCGDQNIWKYWERHVAKRFEQDRKLEQARAQQEALCQKVEAKKKSKPNLTPTHSHKSQRRGTLSRVIKSKKRPVRV